MVLRAHAQYIVCTLFFVFCEWCEFHNIYSKSHKNTQKVLFGGGKWCTLTVSYYRRIVYGGMVLCSWERITIQ